MAGEENSSILSPSDEITYQILLPAKRSLPLDFYEYLDEPLNLPSAIRKLLIQRMASRTDRQLSAEYSLSTDFFRYLAQYQEMVEDCFNFLVQKSVCIDTKLQYYENYNLLQLRQIVRCKNKLTGHDFDRKRAVRIVQDMFREGLSIEDISTRLGIGLEGIEILIHSLPIDFPVTNRTIKQVQKHMPKLKIDINESPYAFFPDESLRKFIKRGVDADSDALVIGKGKFTEVKFMLYDMWISGMRVEKICQKTGLSSDVVKDIFVEAKLRGREFSDHVPTQPLPAGNRNGVPQIDASGDIVATYQKANLETSVYLTHCRDHFPLHHFTEFLWAPMINPSQRWRLSRRERGITKSQMERITTQLKLGKKPKDIVENESLPKQLVKDIDTTLCISTLVAEGKLSATT